MIEIVIAIIVVFTVISSIIVCLYYKKYNLIFPFRDSMGELGLPIVSFEQNGKIFNFIMDSGSDNSVLNTSSLTKLDYKELQGNRFVYGIDGNQVKTSFVGVKLYSQNCEFTEAFQVFDVPGLNNVNEQYDIEIVGILGNSFLKRYGFLLDFKKLKAYTNGNSNKIKNT